MWHSRSLPVMLAVFAGLLVHRYWPVSGDPHQVAHGAHGGIVIPVDGGRYHVEGVFATGGLFELYLLGADASRIIEVDSQMLAASVWGEGESEAHRIRMTPQPQAGDALGKTSRFAARLPDALQGRARMLTVHNLRIRGTRFRVAIEQPTEEHLVAMPRKIEDEEERELYLTPAGRYTRNDIEANDRQTASERYRGFKARHDASPGPGDRICPVSRTKANPACTWIISGRTYQFCCPPCIDEFVRLAKQQPEQVGEPGSYVR